jgi:hypothetical protein
MGGPSVSSSNSIEQKIKTEIEALKVLATFNDYYNRFPCFRDAVNNIFTKHKNEEGTVRQIVIGADAFVKNVFGQDADPRLKCNYVFIQYLKEASEAYATCARQRETKKQQGKTASKTSTTPNLGIAGEDSRPFDSRLERLIVYANSNKDESAGIIMPYDTTFADAATSGYIISEQGRTNFIKGPVSAADEQIIKDTYTNTKDKLSKNPYYRGVPSIINTYSLTRLYGSEGGAYLVDKKGKRKWYEIDGNQDNPIGYSKVPTTTSIISWGGGDPYGRTPYHFTDFVFCKYWGLIPNNRLITLRRYPAPIVDNLNFPTMDGYSSNKEDNDVLKSDESNNITKENPGGGDSGSNKKIEFPPMATVITYFGEETGNTLSTILKFTTGMVWEEIEAAVHDVALTQNPNQDAGAGGLSSGLTSFAKTLNMLTGNYSPQAILNKENLPPDPYSDGPYENRVIGPVNAITKVYKRSRGIEYTHAIPLIFEYTARPIGGINTKAVLLDILSNFLLVGSVSAMFWGGQHRFVGQPQGYPFIGGKNAMRAWYGGNPVEWGTETIKTFATQSKDAFGLLGDFFNSILGLFKGNPFVPPGSGGSTGNKKGNVVTNYINAYAADRSSGQIPYLQGHKALLTGEPVGEWHVTIGNPMNPIALIGNLICKNMEVEFGDELGPDDFPLSIKVTVNLEHGMARDRDAIQSMFNRGQGRIYSLPDNFAGSSEFETKVDKFTGNRDITGRVKTRYASAGAGVTDYSHKAIENPMGSNPSVWTRLPFVSYSDDNITDFKSEITARSEFRATDWISQKSLK